MRTSNYHTWTMRDLDLIRRLYCEGKTDCFIGEMFGVSHIAVQNVRYRFNIKRPKYHKWTIRDLDLIRRLYCEGKSDCFISEMFGVSHMAVQNVRHRFDIKRPERLALVGGR